MPQLYRYIEGWFTYQYFYDEMIDKYYSRFPEQPTQMIEIGCWFGQSATYLIERLLELDSNSHAFFLDTWLGGKGEPEEKVVADHGIDYVYNEFRKNILSVGYNQTHIIRDDSVKGAANFPDDFFDFIFIDAGHQGWQAYDDLSAWYPKLRQSGTIAGHDSDYPDVLRSVERFCQENGLSYRISPSPQHCWIIEK